MTEYEALGQRLKELRQCKNRLSLSPEKYKEYLDNRYATLYKMWKQKQIDKDKTND